MSDGQKKAVSSRCEEIKGELGSTQRADARARVYLGGYYETIIAKFITPLNVRLVENSRSAADLVENQNNLVEARGKFSDDYVAYQQGLEELVGMNCKDWPEEFYEKLAKVRAGRKAVAGDAAKIRKLIAEHMKLVGALKEEL